MKEKFEGLLVRKIEFFQKSRPHGFEAKMSILKPFLASECLWGCLKSNFAPKLNLEKSFVGQAVTFGNAKLILVALQRKVGAVTFQEN